MGASMKYLSIYECTFSGHDLKSGKAVRNVLHYQTKTQVAGPPAFGAAIAGAGDIDLFAANLLNEVANDSWLAKIVPLLSVNYKMEQLTVKQVIGWGSGAPGLTVTGATNTNPIIIETLNDNNYTAGDSVIIAGALGNTAANGTFIVDNIVDSRRFRIAAVGNGIYLGGGVVTKQNTNPTLTYGDTATVTSTAIGAVIGEALPLHATISVWKRTSSSGRHFRGGVRFSPIAETDTNNGAVVPARLAVWQAALNLFRAFTPFNGGSDAGSSLMQLMLLSTSLALQTPSPFTAATAYARAVTGLTVRPNAGSLTRRKPKLTAPIIQT